MAAPASPPPLYAWVLNLDAELELASSSYNPSARLNEQQASFGADAAALLGPEGVLVNEVSIEEGPRRVGRAWCPTPRAVAAMRAVKIKPELHPPASVLRRVNHRAFAHELGQGLPGQALVHEEKAVFAILADTTHPWLLKRPLVFAGRGQRRVLGPIDDVTRNWISASLRDDTLIVEPFISPRAEFSLHAFLWPDGRREWGRVCVQTVSPRGVFRAVRLATQDDLRATERVAMHAAAASVGEALYRAGYFGPFGIDAYRYCAHGSSDERFCALSEINARYTMSFVTGFPVHPSALHL